MTENPTTAELSAPNRTFRPRNDIPADAVVVHLKGKLVCINRLERAEIGRGAGVAPDRGVGWPLGPIETIGEIRTGLPGTIQLPARPPGRSWAEFVDCYRSHHRHGGIVHTPADVHHGLAGDTRPATLLRHWRRPAAAAPDQVRHHPRPEYPRTTPTSQQRLIQQNAV